MKIDKKVTSNEPFMSDYAIFPEIERINFIAGLLLTDLMAIDNSDEIMDAIGDVLDLYLELIKTTDSTHLW